MTNLAKALEELKNETGIDFNEVNIVELVERVKGIKKELGIIA